MQACSMRGTLFDAVGMMRPYERNAVKARKTRIQLHEMEPADRQIRKFSRIIRKIRASGPRVLREGMRLVMTPAASAESSSMTARGGEPLLSSMLRPSRSRSTEFSRRGDQPSDPSTWQKRRT